VAGRLKSWSSRSVLALGAIVVLSSVVTSCATQDGDALAKQACGYVNTSINLYKSSLSHKSPQEKTHLQDEAYDQLELGLQPASLAAGDDGQWQGLMATIGESSRVPEGLLVNALQQQCVVAQDPNASPNPGTTPVT
jgi:outer membrane PBP1 activator LpoA protein